MRNRRRTFLNVFMIACGIAAIVVFRGFSHNVISNLQLVAINAQYGHLEIASDKLWTLSAKDSPRSRLLQPDQELTAKISALPEVDYISERISFFGLVNSDEHNLSARGIGFDPVRERHLHEMLPIIEGRNLKSNSGFEVVVGVGLQNQLGVKIGQSITVLSYTYDGSVNAIDAEVVGTFMTGLAEIDNSTFYTPLAFAQNLLDSKAYERMIILLKNTGDTDQVRTKIDRILPRGVSTRSWLELANFYRSVVGYFNMQNLLIEWILFILALLAIANTIGMSISERTGEIGTVRAVGDTRQDIMLQFMTEGLVMGIIGGVVGCLLGLFMGWLLTSLKIPIVTPGATAPLLVEVDLLPSAFRDAFLLSCLVAMIATILPAYRASRLSIVDALRRNI
jgi:putative ABC transport system permease protein